MFEVKVNVSSLVTHSCAASLIIAPPPLGPWTSVLFLLVTELMYS